MRRDRDTSPTRAAATAPRRGVKPRVAIVVGFALYRTLEAITALPCTPEHPRMALSSNTMPVRTADT